MRNTKQKLFLTFFVCASLALAAAGGIPDQKSKDKKPSIWELIRKARQKQHDSKPSEYNKAFELLDKYAANIGQIQSFTCKLEILVDHDNKLTWYQGSQFSKYQLDSISGKRKSRVIEELRYDHGKRFRFIGYQWRNEHIDNTFTPTKNAVPRYTSYTWDGKEFFRYAKYRGSGVAIINRDLDTSESRKRIFAASAIANIFGFHGSGHDDERIDSVLRSAKALSVRNQMENVGDFVCHVIDAETNRGKYTVWIDPQHGYNIARLDLRSDENNVYKSTEVLRFKKINDVWIRIESTTKGKRDYGRGDYEKKSSHSKVIELIVNPDHDAIGSFAPDDVLNGARTRILGNPIVYKWQDGKVIDKDGNEFDIETLKPLSPKDKSLKEN